MAHDWPTIRTLRHQLNAVVPLGQAPAGAVQLCVNRSEQTRSWLPCAAPAPLAFASNEAWAETYARCRRFASFLASRSIGYGDTVAAMLPNIPAMNEAHFAVSMTGAVLNALNIRLDAASIAFQLDHGGAKIILVDPEFSAVIAEALTLT